MKSFRFSTKLLLLVVGVVAIALAVDQRLKSKASALENLLEIEFAEMPGVATEYVMPFGGTKTMAVEDMTDWADRLQFRRRVNAKLISVGKANGAMIEMTTVSRTYLLGAFATECNETCDSYL